MKTITIVTPANIEVEYRLAGAGSRLAAFAIDFMIQMAACILLALVVLYGLMGLRTQTLTDIGGFAAAILIIAVFVINLGYFIFCELTMNGQSVGKKIFGLRVIRDNGQPIDFTQSLVRNLFRTALDMLYVGLFVILFSKKHKRFGDMAAGTVVVSERYGFDDIPLSIPVRAANLAPQFKHIHFTDDERYLLNAYLRRRDQLPENGKDIGGQMSSYFAEKWQIDSNLLEPAVLVKMSEIL